MKNKKKIMLLTLLIASLMLGFVIYINFFSLKDEKERFDSYDEDILLVNELHPTDIVLYGEDVNFRKNLKYRKIDNINNDTLAYDTEKHERLVLIINDLNSTVNISDAEYVAIKKGLEENKIDLLYYGTTKMDDFIKHEIFDYPMPEDELGIGIGLADKKYTELGGIWTKDEQEMVKQNKNNDGVEKDIFGQVILLVIADCIKSNHVFE